MIWLIFAASASAIVLAGTRLSRYGDQIAELTGLGRVWIGVVLMAAATSLPEVFTTISAGWLNAADLAAGDLFGAGLTNMLTLGLIDLLHRQKRVWQQAALEHTLTAALAMVLTALAAFFVLLPIHVTHLAYRGGSLLGTVSQAHALTALWSILMMNIGLMGIIYRVEKRFMLIEPDSLLMIISYALGLWLLFR